MSFSIRRFNISILFSFILILSCSSPDQSVPEAFALVFGGSAVNNAPSPSEPKKPWPKFLGVFGKMTFASGASVDPDGNIIATGFTEGDLGGQPMLGKLDSYITKYDEDGNKLWIRHLGGGPKDFSKGSTYGLGITSDKDGNVLSTGMTVVEKLDGQNKIGYQDAYLSKYDKDGNKKWTKMIGGGSNTDFHFGTSAGRGITSDQFGNIYVNGTTNADTFFGETNPAGQNGYFMVKYDPDGNQLWARMARNTNPNNLESIAGDLTIDSNGEIYFVGAAQGGFDDQAPIGIEDALLIKYDSDGNKVWVRTLGVLDQVSIANDIGIDPDRNVYIVGTTSGELDGQTPIGTTDTFIVKYDKDGNKLWTRLIGNPDYSDFFRSETQGFGITVDPNGNSYIAGTISAVKILFTNSINSAFAAKFDTDGNLVWSNLKYMEEVTKCEVHAQDVVLGLNDSFFVVGYTSCLLSIIDPAKGINSLFISKEMMGSSVK
ncbi:SBBP repeat-containing protein [Leptospira venezuelensis]|uniref:SBBP repeat-containing protein n=1 Tax=Leptospira venezuelensis TaxID=1958811 RepID=UPI000A3858EB|nr:SBBP repeat-containing protein [Leptospira venezuelensis]